MTRVVVLLRGINVGGHHKVPMAQLRELALALGLTEPTTYIQSGNLVATDPAGRDPDTLAGEFSAALEQTFGFEVPAVVIPARRWAQIATTCPWPELADPRFAHAVVYPVPIPDDVARTAQTLVTDDGTDRVAIDGEVLW